MYVCIYAMSDCQRNLFCVLHVCVCVCVMAQNAVTFRRFRCLIAALASDQPTIQPFVLWASCRQRTAYIHTYLLQPSAGCCVNVSALLQVICLCCCCYCFSCVGGCVGGCGCGCFWWNVLDVVEKFLQKQANEDTFEFCWQLAVGSVYICVDVKWKGEEIAQLCVFVWHYTNLCQANLLVCRVYTCTL